MLISMKAMEVTLKIFKLADGIAAVLLFHAFCFLSVVAYEVWKAGGPTLLTDYGLLKAKLLVALWMSPFVLIALIGASAVGIIANSQRSQAFVLRKIRTTKLISASFALAASLMCFLDIAMGDLADRLRVETSSHYLIIISLFSACSIISLLNIGLEQGIRANEENESFV